jgi:uncharacterized membrane protein
MLEALALIARWLHIASVVTLIGGILYSRLVLWPSLGSLPADERKAMEETVARRFQPLVWIAISGLVLSGLYNLMINPGHSPRYHMLLGIKLLLALHVFAVALLIVQPNNQRRGRLLTGTMISGLIVIAISAYLRLIF